MEYNNLLLSITDRIALVTINRPKALNAINEELMSELGSLFMEDLPKQDIAGVIITGSGEKAFIAGADITQFPSLDKAGGSEKSRKGHNVFNAIENFHKPVIAAINGFSLGGGNELAMACHMRIAAENARFGQPEVNLGLVPGYGGTQRLTQLVGKAKSMELNLTGDMIKADEAHRIGLVNQVVGVGESVEAARAILQKIATKGPLAVSKAIALVNASVDPKQDGFELEIEYFGECMGSDQCKEGVTAFLEKRKAEFK